MIKSEFFLKSLVDTLPEHIVVIDPKGQIQFVNESWISFARNNDCVIKNNWKGINYLETCDTSAANSDDLSALAVAGIRKVVQKKSPRFYFEYPCHSPDEKRWFMMRVVPFEYEDRSYFVISHQNITERKLAEEKVRNSSRLDGLTKIPNRKHFDEFLYSEWQRCSRLKIPLSLAMIDIDHFKLLNDTYGHLEGDRCLKKISSLLKQYARRPGDVSARYGGEEFAIVLGNTKMKDAKEIMALLMDDIHALKIPNEKSPVLPILTVSIGLASIKPDQGSDEKRIIEKADQLLYAAKRKGRNQIVSKNECF